MNWSQIFGKRSTWFSDKRNESQPVVVTSPSTAKILSANHGRIDPVEVQIPSLTDRQTEPKRYEDGAEFEGELVGRRLLQVCGSRTVGAKYRFSDEADIFWLALEGDTPEQIIWLSPQWKYRGANAGFELDVEVKTLPVGQMPTDAMASSTYSQPSWQALTGLYLYNIHSRTGYEQERIDPLTLYFARQFEPSVNVTNTPTAKLSFDSPDLDEPFVMGISGDTVLRHWALRSDIQLSLADVLCADGVINTRSDMPPAPWGDKEHLIALNVFTSACKRLPYGGKLKRIGRLQRTNDKAQRLACGSP